ncbi:MAG TPA: DPP IV N-terminal domain-containing protein [Gemmataceae bacterium]|nr:DPP IV N-terminal domain-containing protein [Gemmataceae bacterium]
MRRVLVSVALCSLAAAGAAVFAAPAGESGAAAGDKEYTLLVSSTRTGNAEIFLVNPEWGDARNLTRHKGDDTFPAWSADGKKIAFISDRDGRPNVYVMDADGKRVKQLTNEKGEKDRCYCPTWSPDGKKLAYCRIREGKGADTIVMDADGSNDKSIRDNAWDPAWSPDGKKIAITAWTDKGFKVCVMDRDGTNLKEFATGDNFNGNVYPCWSPDGKKIAYTDVTEGGYEIHVCDADGKNIKKLTTVGGLNTYSAWSSDGKTIAFSHNEGTGPVSIYLMDADGSNAREIPALKEQAGGSRPAWRPK